MVFGDPICKDRSEADLLATSSEFALSSDGKKRKSAKEGTDEKEIAIWMLGTGVVQ